MSARARLMTAIVGFVAASLGVASVVRAQVRATVDVGGASIRYNDSVRVTATTVAPTVRIDDGPFTALAFGSFSTLDGAWSSQGNLAASLLSPAFGVGRLEAAATGGGTLHQDGTRTGRYLAQLRVHASTATRGLWIGGGAGQGWNGAVWRRVIQGDLTGWFRHDDVTLLGTVQPVAIAGDSIRYTDASAMVRRDGAHLELAASAAFRLGVRSLDETRQAWASGSAAWWLTPQIALAIDVGSYPADFAQGFRDGSYGSLSLRIAPGRRVWTRQRAIPVADPVAARTVGNRSSVRVDVAALDAGRYTVRIYAPSARRVEIMGDFTEWSAITLTPAANGWWMMVTRITPGLRQVTARIDGGQWTVPAGAHVEQDEYGAPVGVIMVR